jgi:hypothetical protein
MTDDLNAFDFYSREEGSEPTPETGGVFGSGITLEELAARPGPYKALADELILVKAERDAKAEKERMAAEAAEAAESGFDTLSPERLQAALTAQAEGDRATGDAAWLAAREADIRVAYPDPEQAELKIAEEREALAAVNEFLGAPGPADVPAWREHQLAIVEEQRGVALARDLLLRDRSIEQDADEAAEGIRRSLESIAGVPG